MSLLVYVLTAPSSAIISNSEFLVARNTLYPVTGAIPEPVGAVQVRTLLFPSTLTLNSNGAPGDPRGVPSITSDCVPAPTWFTA